MGSKKKRKLWFLCAGASDGRLPKAKVEGLLFSAGHDVKDDRMTQKTKEMIKKAKPKYKMLDSGGYQILKSEKKGTVMTFDPKLPLTVTKKRMNITPRHVVEKDIEINADSMVALDFPIRKIKDPDEQKKEFRKKLRYNVSWAIETAKLRKKLCPDVSLFIPVQAYDLRQFEVFYKKIKGIKFDGFSLPVRNMSMKEVALFLLRMHKMGIKKVHVLGSSSLPIISVCAYMSEQFFEWVSFDATSWRISAQFGSFIHPVDLSYKKLKKSGSYDKNFRCHCQSCRGMTLGEIAALDRKDRMKILLTHNYLAIQNFCKELGEASFDAQYLENRLRKSKRRDVARILKCMTEIEEICSTNNHKNTRTRNYSTSPLHAHI